MAIITRRQFVKSIGLCTVLAAIGDINDGLSFFPYHLSSEKQRTGSSVSADHGNTAKHLYIGVGATGFKVVKALLVRTKKIGTLEDNSLPIQQFDPTNSELNGLIANSHVVFLVGSIKDKDFWIARELIESHPILLLNTIIIDDQNPRLSAKSFNVYENEGCIFVPRENYEYMAALNIYSLFSMVMMPGHVGYDLVDHVSVLRGKSGYMVHTENSYRDSLEMFKRLLFSCKPDLQTASDILVGLMYNETISCTLDHMTALTDMVYENSSNDIELLWNCTIEPPNLGVEFRASMFIPFS